MEIFHSNALGTSTTIVVSARWRTAFLCALRRRITMTTAAISIVMQTVADKPTYKATGVPDDNFELSFEGCDLQFYANTDTKAFTQ
jgi:hypothetical protein